MKEKNLFPSQAFCQEVEGKGFFILVVELPHSEAFSWLFQAEAPVQSFGKMLTYLSGLLAGISVTWNK